ncbi:ADP-ribosylglycohydrolase family protein [Metabacillus sp. GX 13764]|uniref:ADP-ribosylglycohydrolase family protein n=1 Tax=Metabacillus kandeliae TaxID=2900151 RepID=UPI001E400772|nr:ADP-ribosylglycohydrolase family protein [Metabacillus kandeliae]MCD7035654.1 ADP-ribosylglycohydrolase family protein [Metabacillus kandeliae]
MISFQERVRGAILGAAYGDALGAVAEKLSFGEIKAKFGKVESLHTHWYKDDVPEQKNGKERGGGIVTDDTLMMLALMRVYEKEKRHLDAYDFGNEFMKEIAFRKTYIPEFGREAVLLERLFYPEKYAYTRHVLANCEPREGGIGNMVNCGAAMYMAPVGIVNAGNPKGAYDEGILFAMGHQHSYGLEAAGVMAACTAKAMETGTTAEDLVETALIFAKDGTKLAIEALAEEAFALKAKHAEMDELTACLHRRVKEFSPMEDDVARKEEKLGIPSAHYAPGRLRSIEELPVALAFLLINDGSFYPSVRSGVNSGRDTDSIGAMIGALAGAMDGMKAAEEEDIRVLESANRLQMVKAADSFSDTALFIIKNDLMSSKKRERLLNLNV